MNGIRSDGPSNISANASSSWLVHLRASEFVVSNLTVKEGECDGVAVSRVSPGLLGRRHGASPADLRSIASPRRATQHASPEGRIAARAPMDDGQPRVPRVPAPPARQLWSGDAHEDRRVGIDVAATRQAVSLADLAARAASSAAVTRARSRAGCRWRKAICCSS